MASVHLSLSDKQPEIQETEQVKEKWFMLWLTLASPYMEMAL
jgi:hypothetical protein